MGLQHCLAMLGGIVTVPALIAGDACFPWQFDAELCGAKEYMISASIFVSGILTIVQIVRFRLLYGYYLGTGLLSVMGTSFTFLPIARDIVTSEIRAGRSGLEAYGAFLGTCMVAAFLEIGISFIPPKVRALPKLQPAAAGIEPTAHAPLPPPVPLPLPTLPCRSCGACSRPW
jgi:NCS2 family nucleobase:cation symporter-2